MRICLISFSEKRNKKAALYCASGVVSDVLSCEMMHLIYPLMIDASPLLGDHQKCTFT